MAWWKTESKELAKDVAPGVIKAFFGFLRSLFAGKKAAEAAKELADDVVEAVADEVEIFVEEGVAHEIAKLTKDE